MRRGWARFAFVVMMPGLKLPPYASDTKESKCNDRTAKHIGVATPLDSQPYLAFFDCKTGAWQPGWIPSQADLFADDWQIFPNYSTTLDRNEETQ